MAASAPFIGLFGYEASAFTIKVRNVLRLKQVPYTFISVPSMMPRPVLKDNFNLTYRKIPVLAIGRDVYCDSSIIIDALEHFMPSDRGFGTVYPATADGQDYTAMMRGFASYWTDRPMFRVMTGLIPADVWRTSFGRDRAGLIGHELDADKLERKIPENLMRLDMHLSILEPLFADPDKTWVLSTKTPSLADVTLYTWLYWGSEIAKGHLLHNLTGGELADTETEGSSSVWNAQRYPALWRWFQTMQRYLGQLPLTETKDVPIEKVLQQMNSSPTIGDESLLLPTSTCSPEFLVQTTGLTKGTTVSVAPDDTGRDDPTVGKLIDSSPEEVVIKPHNKSDKSATVDVRIHFPKLGFVVRPVDKVMQR